MADRKKGYGQFCPVAKAAEVVAARWTPLVLRELIAGSRRFSEIQRGVPLMSPSLLSARLKELEDAGVIRSEGRGRGKGYVLTDAGRELEPIIEALGVWGQRWVWTRVDRDDLDPSLLMWDVRRRVRPEAMPVARAVIEFHIRGVPGARRRWWLIIGDGEPDLCLTWPGYDTDLTVTATIRVLVDVWMGARDVREAIRSGDVALEGSRELAKSFPEWFGLSSLAAAGR